MPKTSQRQQEMAEPSVHPPDFSTHLQQNQSPLFSVIPPEIRHQIFTFALSDFEDTDKPYDAGTFWTRPGYNAPRRTCTELLRTCKRVYMEAWYMPFAYSEHSFYFTGPHRAPPSGTLSEEKFQKCLDIIHEFHGEVEAGHIRVFAQLYMLEPGEAFENLLNMRHFYPKSVTLTIRHTDFWHWERNERFRIEPEWVNRIRFPNTVTKFNVDFESIERRKGEIDYIANQAADVWFFQRKDDVVLTARKEETSVSKWTGSSMLGENRWVRDEVRPSQIEYHVATVTWRASDKVAADFSSAMPCPRVVVPHDFKRPAPPNPAVPKISEDELRAADISPDMPAEEAVVTVKDFRRRERESRRQVIRRP